MKTYTKESLIVALRQIKDSGWIQNARPSNVGGVGNTLEDLLGIKENNLPIPNAAEWELKTQRADTTSLTTLFHMEPSPRALQFVSAEFLPKYGWKHKQAGIKYPKTEMSFRQTINGLARSDRGFGVVVDREAQKVMVSFDSKKVAVKHLDWLKSVEERIGLSELNPQPYWGFEDLHHKAGTKLLNAFYVVADRKKENGTELFHYNQIFMLQAFSFENFLNEIERGNVLIDFDARTGHNHGTKFRLRQNSLPRLYSLIHEIE